MILFGFFITSLVFAPAGNDKIFRIVITDDEKDNVTTWFRGKKYKRTLATKDIKHIIKIIKAAPGLFDIPKELEPNESLGGGTIYGFTFCDGERTNSFYGKNILDYGRRSRKYATLALHTAREIKEKVLEPNNIRTMISSRLQHWPKYRIESDFIPVCGCPKLPK